MRTFGLSALGSIQRLGESIIHEDPAEISGIGDVPVELAKWEILGMPVDSYRFQLFVFTMGQAAKVPNGVGGSSFDLEFSADGINWTQIEQNSISSIGYTASVITDLGLGGILAVNGFIRLIQYGTLAATEWFSKNRKFIGLLILPTGAGVRRVS